MAAKVVEDGVEDREEDAIEAVVASFRGALGSFFVAAVAFFPFFAFPFGKGFVGTSGELMLAAVEGPGVDRSEGAALSG